LNTPPNGSGVKPALSESNERFFEAARGGKLVIQRCGVCAAYQFALPGPAAPPAVEFCRTCGAGRPNWVEADGTGTLVTYAVIPGRRRSDGEVVPPRTAGFVELAEGPWVTAVVDCDPAKVVVGMSLTVTFPTAAEETEPLPVFVPPLERSYS
jgi:uncharacterized OB-fold protein